MEDIKPRKQLTHVLLKDGRTLVTQATPKEIDEYLSNHSHIMIEGEWHSKYDIVNYIPVNMDDLEWYIISQTKEIQDKLRSKKRRLWEEQGRNMSLEYAKNYVSILSKSK